MATGLSKPSFTYDVFLSFYGKDTRYSFTGNLCRALRHSGIHTFMDDNLLRNYHEITSVLAKEIEDSRIFIIVFSQNYAFSFFCLNELAYILECVKRKGLLVFPVFYNVDPSDVRDYTGIFGEALTFSEAKFKARKEGLDLEHNTNKQLEKWDMALHEIANLYGYVFKHGEGYEYDFIKRIVELVSSKINQALLDVTDYPVGLESCSDAFSYDVFVSFRGLDTRYGFTGNLYNALRDKGIHPFIDHEQLQIGEKITAAHEKAIEDSKIFIIVLSENYASSSFCLNELTYILESVKRKSLSVFPVFYDVHPSHVRRHSGSFGEALAYHEANFKDKKEGLEHNMEKLHKWRMALTEIADVSGSRFTDGKESEYDFIKKVVKRISLEINRAPLHVADYPVGLEPRVIEVMKLLDVGSNDGVHMIGIHGLGGIGKTTLALTVYNSIADRFEGVCFLKDMRENSYKHGLQHLQSILLSKMVGEKNIKLASVKQGISIIQHRLRKKKVLLILDDVDKLEQLQAIVGEPDWFGPGSRVIITTRDKQLLSSHGVKRTYEVKELNKNDALQLLSWKAFKTEKVDTSYVDILDRVVTYASGLPLALEVIGSKLFGKSIKEWEFAINQYDSVGLESCSDAFCFDVFVSFRAKDTCHGFTLNLYKALYSKGIRTFIDDEELQRGKEIKPTLMEAIQESKVAITVLSQHYASSSFCLDELATILHCHQRKQLLVIPVFYKVDHSDVRHQKGSYGKALAKLERRFQDDPEKLQKWKMALQQVADLSGYHFKEGDEYEDKIIEKIVEQVSRVINLCRPLPIAEYPVGKSIKEWKFAINQYDSVGQKSCSDAFSYDVFLSFVGSDTLHGFTGYLYKALHDSGIHTFIDEELQRGEEMTPAIVKTIETSRIAIIVVSENYVSSSLFLDELVTILDCLKRKSLLVLPVFYNVDPSYLQPQKGSYGEALAKHEERFKHNMEKLEKWNMVLYQVANLSGFHIKHGTGYEYEFIGEIVEWVTNKINSAHDTVGLGSRVLEVKKLLDVGCDDGIHMLGIYGVGGVGKSTLAREVYNNLIAEHFDASCFIENVREKTEKHVQNILLSKILGEKDINLISMQEGISMIQSRLQPKKVLLILDDVDRHEQLKAVVGRPVWLGPGSIVIITAQGKQLLASLGVKKTYEVKELNKNDALQFLKWKAFKTQYFDPRYEEVLNRAVTYASGLPLALEIIGSNLFGKSVEEWESSIHQFEKGHDNPIQVILKASFDSLEEKERSVFLDIACCFKGYELAEVQDILHAHYGHCIKYYIDVLIGKSLVKLSHGTKPCYDTVTLHDLIEGMGKEINRMESLTEPGERRRLRLPEDIREVLGYNKGTSKIEIICLDFPIFDEEVIVEWDGKAFQNMQNLKTLIIKNGNFSKGPEYLPNSLRVLEWWRYPSHCLPSDFHPKELSICKLPCSHISTIELTNLSRKSVNLRVLNFSSADV